MHRLLLFLFLILTTLSAQAQEKADSTANDTTMQGAKMKELVVTKDRRLPIFPSKKILDPQEHPHVKSLSEIIGAKATDVIMHPFAFSQRKKEKRMRKAMKKLQEYDLIKSDNELLREALIREGIDPDSLMREHLKK
ncbi:MAG: hypothetical protein IJ197_02465 [Bacteroidaceae bacterium]|nr:hypothetical protein [Bacteroidaceae bacterium]